MPLKKNISLIKPSRNENLIEKSKYVGEKLISSMYLPFKIDITKVDDLSADAG